MSDRTHRQLKTVSNGLLVYGIVGIVLTVILLGITRHRRVAPRHAVEPPDESSRDDLGDDRQDGHDARGRGVDIGQLLVDDRAGRDDDRPGRATLGEVVTAVK